MSEFNLLAVLVAAIAAFLLSSVYYAVFASAAGTEASAGTKPPAWKLGVEFVRALILASVVAGVGARCGIRDWSGGLLLGLALWTGFPLVLWMGAVTWEGTRLRVAAVHLGDWLAKLLVVAAIVAGWP